MNECTENKLIKGLNIFLHKEKEPFKYILKARELHILPNNKWVMIEGTALESTIYSTFSFDESIKYPPELQTVKHIFPLSIRFQSKDRNKVITPDMSLPIYNTGLYQLNQVVVESISLSLSCCCNRLDILEMMGTYTCMSNEFLPISNYCDNMNDMVIPPEPSIPLCDNSCNEDWVKIPNPKVIYEMDKRGRCKSNKYNI